jgi:RNA polymerase sigma-70 factor (ECF subfamily)
VAAQVADTDQAPYGLVDATSEALEQERIARARNDPRAFDELFAPYWGPILRFCYTRQPTREDAEETANDIFLAAAAKLSQFTPRGPGSFRGWLFTIARNRVVSLSRKRRLTLVSLSEPSIDYGPGWIAPDPNPEEIAMAEDAHEELKEFLAVLTPDQRAVIELRAAELSTKDIAAQLGLSEQNVRQLEHRAIERMRAVHRRQLAEGGHHAG